MEETSVTPPSLTSPHYLYSPIPSSSSLLLPLFSPCCLFLFSSFNFSLSHSRWPALLHTRRWKPLSPLSSIAHPPLSSSHLHLRHPSCSFYLHLLSLPLMQACMEEILSRGESISSTIFDSFFSPSTLHLSLIFLPLSLLDDGEKNLSSITTICLHLSSLLL